MYIQEDGYVRSTTNVANQTKKKKKTMLTRENTKLLVCENEMYIIRFKSYAMYKAESLNTREIR